MPTIGLGTYDNHNKDSFVGAIMEAGYVHIDTASFYKNEEEIEIENILAGKPSYPDVPDLKQAKTKQKKCGQWVGNGGPRPCYYTGKN